MTRYSTTRKQLLARRMRQARERQPEGETLRDPIEDDPLYQAIVDQARSTVDQWSDGPWIVTCHERWGRLEQVLLEEYGVIWFSPAEMNPHVMFD